MTVTSVVFGKRENTKAGIFAPKLEPAPIIYTGPERRKFPRRKMLKTCKIIFNNRSSVFDGVMVNKGENGARLQVQNSSYVAREFLLATVFGNQQYYCSIAWRAGDLIGVQFDD
ncbi:MAG: hypothetical protein OCD03_12980 [Hyphomicrobiales bacterium]